MITTIQLDEEMKNKLDSLKIHHRETYNELIGRMVSSFNPSNFNKQSLIETIETLSNPEEMREIAKALEEIQKGNLGQPISQVRKELGV